MYIHDERRIGYLTPPRTASRAVAQLLAKHGFREVAGHHGIDAKQLDSLADVYVTVRNHWDTLASWFTVREHFGPIEQWFRYWYERDVLSGGSDGMACYVEPGKLFGKWTRHATVILRYEQLASDLTFCMPFLTTPLERVTDTSSTRNGKPYWEFYSEHSRDYIGEVFATEINLLRYEFA